MQNSQNSENSKAYVIVVGNEKGGAGKTTSAMHVITSLLALNFKVGSIDTDSRQLSLTRYIDNRKNTAYTKNFILDFPNHFAIKLSNADNLTEREAQEQEFFLGSFNELVNDNDFIVIDTPGSNSYLSKIAHSYADTVITPINDSFIDLDVLAKVEADSLKILQPAIYSQMIWEQKMQRAKRDQQSINWIVMRNRLSNINAKNKLNMSIALERLAQRIGFRIAPGFGERVIFKELFLQGLTLPDIKGDIASKLNIPFNISHIAARQELRDFLKFLNISKIDQLLEEENQSSVAIDNLVNAS